MQCFSEGVPPLETRYETVNDIGKYSTNHAAHVLQPHVFWWHIERTELLFFYIYWGSEYAVLQHIYWFMKFEVIIIPTTNTALMSSNHRHFGWLKTFPHAFIAHWLESYILTTPTAAYACILYSEWTESTQCINKPKEFLHLSIEVWIFLALIKWW